MEMEYQQLTDYDPESETEIRHMVGIVLYLTAILLKWYDGGSAIFYHARAETLCNMVVTQMTDFLSYFDPLRDKIMNHAEALTDWVSEYMMCEDFLSDVLLGAEDPDPSPESAFNRAKILSLITAEDADIIADILIEALGKYVGKNSPKQALLPIYCAIYEINWMAQRPEYDDFVAAFPGICNNAASYTNYVPTVKENSSYHKPSCKDIEIDNMCESLLLSLNRRISLQKDG